MTLRTTTSFTNVKANLAGGITVLGLLILLLVILAVHFMSVERLLEKLVIP
jgi:hypothetical protein